MAKGVSIPEATIEEIKARTDLSDLISSYGIQVRTSGSSKKACCPFHNEKTPSFHINDNKGYFHCFGCGENGDAIKFVQKMEGLTFVEAVKKLAGQCGITIEEREDQYAGKRKRLYALMAELSQFYHRCLLKTKEASLAREYLAKRDLDCQVQEDFLIGYAPNGISNILKWAEKYNYTQQELADAGVIKLPRDANDRGYHRFGGRLMFSIRDKQGRVVAFSGRQLVANKNSGKYVNSPETLIFKKSNILFGFDKAAGNIAKSKHHEAIICEGQIDTIRLHISGFPVAVASQGTAFTEDHVRILKKVADQVVLVFDDDPAGHKATIRTAGLFLAEEMPVRVVSLPGGDDPDSYLRSHSKDEFQVLLDGAESIMSFQVRVEKSKESDSASIDAVNRITKSVLATIIQSSNAVLRASMVGEASKLLGLPSSALMEELEKVKSTQVKAPKSVVQKIVQEPSREVLTPDDDYEDPIDEVDEQDFVVEDPIAGMDAAKAMPPPDRELALCEFLMANEYDKTLDAMIGAFLPRKVFVHEFSWKFIETWRAECANDQDLFGAWGNTLSAQEREWFDASLLGQTKSGSSGLSSTDIMQEFVRALWVDHLRRVHGALPASGDSETDMQRMRISMELKRLQSVRWHVVKEMIATWI